MVLGREFLAIALLLRVTAAAFGSANESKVVVDLHASRAEIREVLLRYTPIGSKLSDALKFVATRLERAGGTSPKVSNGPASGRAAEGSRRRGVKTIRVNLGQYYYHPGVLFLSAPMIMQREVSAQWAFDQQDRLIDIFVDKESAVY